MPPLVTVRVGHGQGGGVLQVHPGMMGSVHHNLDTGRYDVPQRWVRQAGAPQQQQYRPQFYGQQHPPMMMGGQPQYYQHQPINRLDGHATYGGQRTNYMNFGEWQQRFGNGYGANAYQR